MAKQTQKPAVIIHMDKQREIYFDMNSLADLEEKLGVDSAFEVLGQDKLGFRVMIALSWAGMKHKEPKLSVEEAGRRLSVAVQRDGIKDIMEQLTEALKIALGMTDEREKEMEQELAAAAGDEEKN